MQHELVNGFRISPRQRRLWHLASKGRRYAAGGAFRVDGRLGIGLLRRAFQAVIARYEIFRTGFSLTPGMGEPVQRIDAEPRFHIEVFDLRQVPDRAGELDLGFFMGKARFDDGESASIRVSLVRLSDTSARLFVTLPSLCGDGPSLEILVQETASHYRAFLSSTEVPEEEVPQYADLSQWLNDLLTLEETASGRAFWRDRMPPELHNTRLPFEGFPVEEDAPFMVLRHGLGSDSLAALTRSSRKWNVPVATSLQGGWSAFLHRLTGESELVVGVGFDGRNLEELKGVPGPLSTVLPVATRWEPKTGFAEWLARLDRQLAEAAQNQHFFEWDRSGEREDLGYFSFGFDYEEAALPAACDELRFEQEETRVYLDRFNLRLSALQANGRLEMSFHYDRARYETGQLRLLAARFEKFLEWIARDSDPNRFDILGANLRRLLVSAWNRGESFQPRFGTLPQWIETLAARFPDRVALVWEPDGGSVSNGKARMMSYGGLRTSAARLAQRLRKRGVGSESLVPIHGDRSPELVVAMLGAWFAGAAYVPLDPRLPRRRLTGLLAALRAPLVLSREPDALAGVTDRPVLGLDRPSVWPEVGVSRSVLEDQAAYAIFTSGSTGIPKAVWVAHRALATYVDGLLSRLDLQQSAGFAMLTTFAADLGYTVLFGSLCTGGTLHLFGRERATDPAAVADAFARHPVDVVKITPSHLETLWSIAGARVLPRRWLVLGGEAASPEWLAKVRAASECGMLNHYGPAEATVGVLTHEIRNGLDAENGAPLGRPLPNDEIYVLDRRGEPTPLGNAGEIYLGGPGLARGYVYSAQLTAACFLPHPFSTLPGARLYRTGDRARFLADGTVAFLGRVDRQLKIRGYRVELGEIEAALGRHPAVQRAVVVSREADKNRLAAYILPHRGYAPEIEGRPRYRLPNGMEIVHQNSYETDFLYHEIFAEDLYLQHGISLPAEPCVFDVGANIGMFSLRIGRVRPRARIFAFEPLAQMHQALRINAELYLSGCRTFECGLGEREHQAEFTFYPRSSAQSGLGAYADPESERNLIHTYMKNASQRGSAEMSDLLGHAGGLLRHRFEAETRTCAIRRLSDVIREEAVARIDLLKIDVQRAELDVLRGIDPGDWPLIGQIVMEVHDEPGTVTEGRMARIRNLLEERGYRVTVAQDPLLSTTHQHNLYAVRESYAASLPDPEKIGVREDEVLLPEVLRPASMRHFLAARLPDYMVPSDFVVLESLPLTPNGKLDLAALPEPGDESARSGEPYRSPEEEIMAAIWAEVLERESVDRQDNFFELGGHSLLATLVIARARKTFGLDLAVDALFEAPTVAGLCARMRSLSFGDLADEPPIRPFPRVGHPEASFAQQRLWVLHQIDPESTAYHIPLAVRCRGLLDEPVLERALTEVVRRHEALRTTFAAGEPVARQIVAAPRPVTLLIVDWRGIGATDAAFQEVMDREMLIRFDLARGPLWRLTLLRLENRETLMLLTMHHIISDGWSMEIFIRELGLLYEAFSRGRSSPLQEPAIQYADFSQWQREWLRGEVLERQLRYWRERLAGAPKRLTLPRDRSRPSRQRHRGGLCYLEIEAGLGQALRDLSRESRATMFMTLGAAFSCLLSRYSGQDDVSLGTGVANRNRPEIENLLGFFINTLVLRSDFSDRPSFRALLARFRQNALQAYRYQDLPFDRLVEDLAPDRSLNRNPLFQVLFTLQGGPEQPPLSGVSLSLLQRERGIAKFDLTLFLRETRDGLRGVLEYNRDLFDADTIGRMADHYRHFLQEVADDPDQAVHGIPLLTEQEREHILFGLNRTAAPAPAHGCIHDWFADTARGRPESAALAFEGRILTFAGLDASANRMARRLRELGVGPESLVGICLPRSPELMIGMLAILKAGGAYLPLDPAYPQDRLAFMLQDSGVATLVVHDSVLDDLPAFELQFLNTVTVDEAGADGSAAPLESHGNPDHLAYVIYTSGSSGRPKGSAITHGGLANYLVWCLATYRGSGRAGAPFHGAIGFDATITSQWAPLLAGDPVTILSEKNGLEGLRDALTGPAFDFVKLTPAHLDLLSRFENLDLRGARTWVVGGEAFTPGQLSLLRKLSPGARIFNEYGPTETVVGSSVFDAHPEFRAGLTVPIGRPIANTQTFVLDPYLRPLPFGVAGELFIGGSGVSRGYLGRPDLSADRFLPNPYTDRPGSRFYRSGDRARLLADGNLEYLGRLDDQVKIRGYRIEPGEIERRLTAHPALQDAAVAVRTTITGEKELAAYLVPDRGKAATVGRLLRLQREGRLTEASRHELPNGLIVAHQNRNTTEYLYREIFADRFYLKHGIALREGACIFDVGANIGMASLFFGLHAKDARIFAFEPIPEVYECLRLNAELYQLNLVAVNAGLSNREGSVRFTYYPHVSVMSGMFADHDEDRETIKATLLLKGDFETGGPALTPESLDDLVKERLFAEEVSSELRTVSSVIREHRVTRIDLLKIDVEKSEHEVIEGIEASDWAKIRQVIVEVHDLDGRLERLRQTLLRQGFEVTVEQDPVLQKTGIYNLYAIRPEHAARSESETSGSPDGSVWHRPSRLIRDVREDLKAHLPAHMVPADFAILESLPLNPNGKVDREALAETEGLRIRSEKFVLPKSKLEHEIAAVWQEALAVAEVGIHDNFFEVGGSSVLLVSVHQKLVQRVRPTLSITDLFNYPTVGSLAAYLDRPEETELDQANERAQKRRARRSRQRRVPVSEGAHG